MGFECAMAWYEFRKLQQPDSSSLSRSEDSNDPSFLCERVCTSDRLLRRMGGLSKVCINYPEFERFLWFSEKKLMTLHRWSFRNSQTPWNSHLEWPSHLDSAAKTTILDSSKSPSLCRTPHQIHVSQSVASQVTHFHSTESSSLPCFTLCLALLTTLEAGLLESLSEALGSVR